MKKKVAIVLSAILAYSMSMGVMAAPSPSIQSEPIAQVVVSSSVAENSNTVAAQSTGVNSSTSSVLAGTTFRTASGQTVDPAAVAMVVTPATAAQAQASAASLAAALTSGSTQVVNFTGRTALSLTDSQGNLNVVNNIVVGLQTAAGEAVSQNGSVSVAFSLASVLGNTTLAEGETVQALYQRADGTWVAVPVVISNGTVAIALPAFGGAVNVTFVVAKGVSMDTIPAAAATSPNT